MSKLRSLVLGMSLLGSLWPLSVSSQSTDQALRVRYSALGDKLPTEADALLLQDLGAIDAKRQEAANNGPGFEPRVVGGRDVEIKNFTEVVRLRFSTRSGDKVCTGVLLSAETVLTAGHCGCGSNYSIEFQVQSMETEESQAFQPLEVTGAPILFPGFDCGQERTSGVGRDLAIVPVSVSDSQIRRFPMWFPTIRPSVQVLAKRDLRALYVTGFGTTNSGRLARNLQGASIGLMSRFCPEGRVLRSVCAMYREFVMARSSFDTGAAPADSCGGDSGGPAYRMDTDALVTVPNGRLVKASKRTLVGIVSRALDGVPHQYPGFCGGGGVYTSVGTTPVLAWLRANQVSFSYDPDPVFKIEESR